jgi:hypothetical protein
MPERDDVLVVATERFERRMAEEHGNLRVEMAQGFGSLRTEMADRNAELLKSLLVFFAAQTAAQTAALAGLLSFFK